MKPHKLSRFNIDGMQQTNVINIFYFNIHGMHQTNVINIYFLISVKLIPFEIQI